MGLEVNEDSTVPPSKETVETEISKSPRKVKGDHVPSHLQLSKANLPGIKIDYETESPMPKSVLNTLGVVDTHIRIKYKNSGSTMPNHL